MKGEVVAGEELMPSFAPNGKSTGEREGGEEGGKEGRREATQGREEGRREEAGRGEEEDAQNRNFEPTKRPSTINISKKMTNREESHFLEKIL